MTNIISIDQFTERIQNPASTIDDWQLDDLAAMAELANDFGSNTGRSHGVAIGTIVSSSAGLIDLDLQSPACLGTRMEVQVGSLHDNKSLEAWRNLAGVAVALSVDKIDRQRPGRTADSFRASKILAVEPPLTSPYHLLARPLRTRHLGFLQGQVVNPTYEMGATESLEVKVDALPEPMTIDCQLKPVLCLPSGDSLDSIREGDVIRVPIAAGGQSLGTYFPGPVIYRLRAA